MKSVYRLLTELSSRKSISRLTGKLAKSNLSKLFIPHFAKVYKINIAEAEKDIWEYVSLNDFFTRRLKQGIRVINQDPRVVISPVDAVITGVGEIKEGTIFDVKGQTYTLKEMLGDAEEEQKYINGMYIVLYLSPTDYHRIHTPISGEIIKHIHKEGKVYPVNEFGLTQMKRVLSRNERLITYIRGEVTEMAVVKVGALNVASIQLSDQLSSSRVTKGDELAYFEFGSTVVLLIKEHTFKFHTHITEGIRVLMGEGLGEMTPMSPEKRNQEQGEFAYTE